MRLPEFSYLGDDSIYLDAACQSLRPMPVMDALRTYYETYNACGGRVKYEWGRKVDETVEETRGKILRLLGLSSKQYSASFSLNTTVGLNMLLQQLPQGTFSRVVTTEIEHNSVFLPTMMLARRLGAERIILARTAAGDVQYDPEQLNGAVVVLNAVSNIDGRQCGNLKDIISDTHARGGIVIVDAAQAMAHQHDLLIGTSADAVCFSAHKMYSASLGVIVAKRELLNRLDYSIVGGGMVSSVSESGFELTPDDFSSRLEPGLQAWGEIIALGQAIDWLGSVRPGGDKRQGFMGSLATELYEGVSALPGVTVINEKASPVISAHSSKIDAHQLAIFLSEAGIMVRSGYFCCNYYLIEKQHLPPLIRFSIGLHNTQADIRRTIQVLEKLTGKV